jgi:murein hydrolase activator
MMRIIFCFALFYVSNFTAVAQQTREQLEKQRQQLKNEIDEAQKLLSNNKVETSKSLGGLIVLSRKSELQDRIVKTIDKDINILDNNIYGIQRDVNRYNRLLDTLQQEYAKSMIYAYKNRGNYEFLNFIFSANNFNDAIKRIAYLKSYRTFREMQGQNIMRTQELRKNRLNDLGATKETKKTSLEMQKEEMDKLAAQKQEQDKIVQDLKRQGKSIESRIADKQRQVARVNAAVKAAIAKAIREEKERMRLAAALEAKKRAEAAKEADRLARIKRAEDDKAERARRAAAIAAGKTPEPITKTVIKEPKVKEPKVAEPVVLSSESITLNASFERNKGSLPWPIDNPRVLNHFGKVVLGSGAILDNNAVTITAPIGTNVKAVFDGSVILIQEIDEGKFTVVLKHGNYFTTYSNINNISVKKDQEVKTGQVLGKVTSDLEGIGAIDFYTAKGETNYDPEKWLRHK